MIRRPPRSTQSRSSAASDVYKRQMQVVSKFTYTLETIIQAGKVLVAVDHVPIRTNQQTRESRLFPSMWSYVRRNAVSIFRVYALYEPLRVFMIAAAIVAVPAAIIWARFLFFYFSGEGEGNVQSLILGSTLMIIAVQLVALGVVADILAANRTLQQRTLERVRRVEPTHDEPGAVGGAGTPPTTGAGAGPATGKVPEPAGRP